MKTQFTLTLLLTAAACLANAEKPSILLIVADDLGYSDLGCYGGEIDTPRLDRLAAQGVRFSNFRVNPMCVVTRTSLLTGHTHTQSGGYQRSAPLAELLRRAGYATSISGKWHQPGHPMDWGFEEFFGFLEGQINSFTGSGRIMHNREKIDDPGPEFYSTDSFTDHAMRCIDKAVTDGKPFFTYLAHNAPHTPLHCDREDVEKYVGSYRDGWEELRAQRYERLCELGLIDKRTIMLPPEADVRRWDELSPETQKLEDFRMATYAGVVERIDRSVGLILDHLEKKGVMDNTLVLFLSDNGGDYSNGNIANDHLQKPWDPKSNCFMPTGWASLKCTPFRWYKTSAHEGGVAVPLILHWPRCLTHRGGTVLHQRLHVADLYPTFLELAGASYPAPDEKGLPAPLFGRSALPLFTDASLGPYAIHNEIFWALEKTTRGLLQDDWKLVSINNGPWKLYDLRTDPAESADMAGRRPDLVERMDAAWYNFARNKTAMVDWWREPLKKQQQGWGWHRISRIMPLTDIRPAMAAEHVPLDTGLTLTFSRPISFDGTRGKTIRLYAVDKRHSPVWQADPEPNHPAHGKRTITFDDLPRLKPDTTYYCLADPGWARFDGKPVPPLNDGAYWYRFRTGRR